MTMMGTAVLGWFWIWPTLVVIGLILLGYLAFRLASGRGRRSMLADTGSARRMLDERYARGEIDADEYQRRRGDLS